MKEVVGYIFFDKEREWESYFSSNPIWADDTDEWYLGGEVRTLEDVFTILGSHGFDDEYISNFIELDIPHEYYIDLKMQSGAV